MLQVNSIHDTNPTAKGEEASLAVYGNRGQGRGAIAGCFAEAGARSVPERRPSATCHLPESPLEFPLARRASPPSEQEPRPSRVCPRLAASLLRTPREGGLVCESAPLREAQVFRFKRLLAEGPRSGRPVRLPPAASAGARGCCSRRRARLRQGARRGALSSRAPAPRSRQRAPFPRAEAQPRADPTRAPARPGCSRRPPPRDGVGDPGPTHPGAARGRGAGGRADPGPWRAVGRAESAPRTEPRRRRGREAAGGGGRRPAQPTAAPRVAAAP